LKQCIIKKEAGITGLLFYGIMLFNSYCLDRTYISSFLAVAGIAFVLAYNVRFPIIAYLEYLRTKLFTGSTPLA
jgi:hypothetical protein